MWETSVTDFTLFLLICIFLVAAHTTQPLKKDHYTILRCYVFQDVIREDRVIDIVYWSVCKESCESKNATWVWLAGMNRRGKTKAAKERISITKEGKLKIRNLRFSDTGEYMCTVKRIDHTSPLRNFATVAVNVVATIEHGGKTTRKPYPRDCKKDYSDERKILVYEVTTLLFFVLFIVAVMYAVYLRRTGRHGNQRNPAVV